MRIALLSDIHANLYALEAVLADVAQRAVDTYWFLGDLVGRGYQPNDTILRVKDLYENVPPADQAAWLLGNHDLNVLGTLLMSANNAGYTQEISVLEADAQLADTKNLELLNFAAGRLDWLRDNLRTTHYQPYAASGVGVYLAHGSYRRDPDGSVNPVAAHSGVLKNAPSIRSDLHELATYTENGPRLLICGHTHISMVWTYDRVHNTVQQHFHILGPLKFDLSHDLVYINPGSVGFPRDSDRYPTYAILEVDSAWRQITIEYHAVSYDVNKFRENMPAWYPDSFWQQVKRAAR